MKKQSVIKLSPSNVLITVVCLFFCALSILPVWMMIVNATRSTKEILGGISLIPSTHLIENWVGLSSKDLQPMLAFRNSITIALIATVLSVYFSSLTAFALITYEFKLKKFMNGFVIAAMLIPGVIGMIGFYRFMYMLGLSNSFIPFTVSAIAAPSCVFFMRQYLIGTMQISIIESARLDGAKEFVIFNRIVFPLMKPALATQAIFSFVGSWNNFVTPSILLTDQNKITLPLFLLRLNSDVYRKEYGQSYLGVCLCLVPIIIIYLIFSRSIIEGVGIGAIKE